MSFSYSYEFLHRRPPPPSYEVTMRSSSRPPPSYELSMRSSSSRHCPSSTSTSSTSTSDDRHRHIHRHHRHHHHHGSRTKVTVRSATATATASSSSASPQPSTSSRREDRKRPNPETSEAASSSSGSKRTTNQEVKREEQPQNGRESSPQPGPSGLQQTTSTDPDSGINAPDLQLDCLSSDSDDDGMTEEDVTVVKISRRRKGTSKKRFSTTTINAPPGSIVEVDLTQESDHPDEVEDEDDDDIRVDAIRPRTEARGGEGLIKLRQFATVPHLPPNVQSRGSTPSTTPAPGTSSDMYEAANPYLEPHSHPCNGECGLFHCPPPPPDYRPRRLRQPYHHQVGCQDAHCRNHHRPSATSASTSTGASSSNAASTSTSTEQQPLDCRYI